MTSFDPEQTTTIEVPSSAQDGQTAKVMYDDTNVMLIWTCGDKREWSKENLARALENFEATGKIDKVIYADLDDKMARYAAFINNEVLVANSTAYEVMDMVTGVDWPKMQAALRQASGYQPPVVAKPRTKRKPSRSTKAVIADLARRPKPIAKKRAPRKKPSND